MYGPLASVARIDRREQQGMGSSRLGSPSTPEQKLPGATGVLLEPVGGDMLADGSSDGLAAVQSSAASEEQEGADAFMAVPASSSGLKETAEDLILIEQEAIGRGLRLQRAIHTMGVPAAAVARYACSAVPILAASRGKVHEKHNLHPHVGLLAAGKRAAPVVKMPCQRPNLGAWPSASGRQRITAKWKWESKECWHIRIFLRFLCFAGRWVSRSRVRCCRCKEPPDAFRERSIIANYQ
ncbi:hypothetical protein V2G26_013801 [Clonostachys chloroleuca]